MKSTSSGRETASSLLLRDGTLWNGMRPETQPGVDILIQHGRIAAVAPAGQRRAQGNVAVMELDRRFVMPALIDMHVHLVWSGSPDPAEVVEREGEQLTTLRAMANAQAQLSAGVTAVRDLGGNWDIALTVSKAIDAGYLMGPLVIASGKTVIMTGGHDPFWGVPSDGPDAVLHAVRRQISLGAGVIKVAATGGVYGRPHGEEIGQSELTREELAVAVTEAHRFGLRVAAHALGREGIANAVSAGVDTIEHGTFLDDELIAEMQRRGTVLCPTLAIYRRIADGERYGIPAYAAAKAQRAVTAHRESFRMAREAGIPIIAGTDAGSCATPHPALIEELEVMREYGMPVEEVLAAATSTAARVLGQPALGTISPGQRADLLILDHNPLDDLSALRAPLRVLRSGRIVRDTSGPMPALVIAPSGESIR
jgi:imidazolonepropionase-like amidohydrolase